MSDLISKQGSSSCTHEDDTISRQAAVDAIQKHSCNTQRIIDAVEALPSAQPEKRTETHACDCISRQAAIDAVKDRYYKYGRFAKVEELGWAIEALPSAQPEEASMILGTSKDGVRLWYQCSACGEPVNADDNYCCNCGRKFING